jgi:hypothetical protein
MTWSESSLVRRRRRRRRLVRVEKKKQEQQQFWLGIIRIMKQSHEFVEWKCVILYTNVCDVVYTQSKNEARNEREKKNKNSMLTKRSIYC